MRIAFINGSPKSKDTASGNILKGLKALLENDDNVITELSFRKPQLEIQEMEQLAECKVLVFAFPLYVDGIPSHLLNCLIQLEAYFTAIKKSDAFVYPLVNCGFYEGHQNKTALEIMKNWCVKSGLKWGQGIGIGSGGVFMLAGNISIGKGLAKSLGNALKKLSYNISKCVSDENIIIEANIPRIIYKLAAEMKFRKMIKENGLKRKDLSLRR